MEAQAAILKRGLLTLIILGAFASLPACQDKAEPPRVILAVASTQGDEDAFVNAPFDVTVTLTDRKTGEAFVPGSPVHLVLSAPDAKGNLAGELEVDATSGEATFVGLTYDQPEQLHIKVSARGAVTADANLPIFPKVVIERELGLVKPGATFAAAVNLRDGLDQPLSVHGTLHWELTPFETVDVTDSGAVELENAQSAEWSTSAPEQEATYGLRVGINDLPTVLVTHFLSMDATLEESSFAALRSARVNTPLKDDLSQHIAGESYGLLSGLPPKGFHIEREGNVTGSIDAPGHYSPTLYVRLPGKIVRPIRTSLAVFSANEKEWKTGLDFSTPGACSVTVSTDTFTYKSSFDSEQLTTDAMIFAPTGGPAGPRPTLLFHRGRGFSYTHYQNLMTRIASHCFVIVSVQDSNSYYGDGAPRPLYDYQRAEAGMQAACAALEGTMGFVKSASDNPAHVLHNRIDSERIFMSGHSRGGGATHACHTRGYDLRLRGVMYWMAFDLRYFDETVPPGVSPVYGIPDELGRLPSLILMGQNDGDLTYPIADELVERATGPTTSVTLYGGIHNFAGDTNYAEGNAEITREEQQELMAHWMTAFLKRWGEDDLSVEGLLYGNEAKASTSSGVAALRNVSSSVLIDDFQDGDPTRNGLGGSNTLTGATASEESFYPATGSYATLGIRNNILIFSGTHAEYSTTIPDGLLPADARRLVIRIAQTSAENFSWVKLGAKLTGRDGKVFQVNLSDDKAPGGPYLPSGNAHTFDRFMQIEIPVSEGGDFDLSKMSELRLTFDLLQPPSVSRQIALDDLRVE